MNLSRGDIKQHIHDDTSTQRKQKKNSPFAATTTIAVKCAKHDEEKCPRHRLYFLSTHIQMEDTNQLLQHV